MAATGRRLIRFTVPRRRRRSMYGIVRHGHITRDPRSCFSPRRGDNSTAKLPMWDLTSLVRSLAHPARDPLKHFAAVNHKPCPYELQSLSWHRPAMAFYSNQRESANCIMNECTVLWISYSMREMRLQQCLAPQKLCVIFIRQAAAPVCRLKIMMSNRNPTHPSIDAHSLEEQLFHISSRSDLKRRSLGLGRRRAIIRSTGSTSTRRTRRTAICDQVRYLIQKLHTSVLYIRIACFF